MTSPKRAMAATTVLLTLLRIVPFFNASSTAFAVALQDYARADQLRAMDPSAIGGRTFPYWLHDGQSFYYESRGLHEQPGKVFLVDPRTATKRPLFDVNLIAASLANISKTAIDPARLPNWTLSTDEQALIFVLSAGEFRCELNAAICVATTPATRASLRAGATPAWATRSPNGKWDAFIWNNNVYIRSAELDGRDLAQLAVPRPSTQDGNSRFGAALQDSLVAFHPTGQRTGCDYGAPIGPIPAGPAYAPPPAGSIALTTDGALLWSYGRRWKGGAEVATLDADRYRPTHGAFAWSPDSKKLLSRREDLRGVGIYPLYSSTSTRPIDHSYYYAQPGDIAVPQYTSYILDIATRKAIRIAVPPIGLVLRPGGAEWSADSRELYVLSSDRGPHEVRLSLVDAASGEAKPIVRETSKTFVEMSNGDDDTLIAVASAGQDIFWFSERDGWGHLYRYDKTGRLKNQVEAGDYSVADLVRVDTSNRQLYFTAWGKAPGIPYYRHLYRISFDGTGLMPLTVEPGDHSIQWFPKGGYFLDTVSSIETPPVTSVRRADGEKVMEISRGSDAALRTIGWRPAEPFTVKARDGTTDLYGVMYRPSDFDPTRKYPIITNLYPGPFKGSVGRTWSFQGTDNYETRGRGEDTPTHGEGLGQSLAELGFIVIKLDALGTARRSKVMQDYNYGRAIDNGLPDQVAAIKQLGARYSFIDINRVGIVGHSGGGFAAVAGMLLYPDIFKVGVGESGNNDFRTYGWYWGEKYQGPHNTVADDVAYEEQASYKYSANLRGKLLLIHGDMDCNNPTAQTLRLVDALIKNQKDFDMLIVPDAGHQLPAYTMRKVWDYFVSNLRGENPPRGYNTKVH